MIVCETDRIYSVYIRTNRQVQWQYAEYIGRWETVEKAIEIAKQRVKEPFEFRVEDFDGVVAVGFANQPVIRQSGVEPTAHII